MLLCGKKLTQSNNSSIVDQIDVLMNLYQLELSERSARRVAKEKDKGSDLDDLINVE